MCVCRVCELIINWNTRNISFKKKEKNHSRSKPVRIFCSNHAREKRVRVREWLLWRWSRHRVSHHVFGFCFVVVVFSSFCSFPFYRRPDYDLRGWLGVKQQLSIYLSILFIFVVCINFVELLFEWSRLLLWFLSFFPPFFLCVLRLNVSFTQKGYVSFTESGTSVSLKLILLEFLMYELSSW